MMLGLVLHSAVSFMAGSVKASWPYRDPMTSEFLKFAVLWIHSYRMHIFFLASGFFFMLLVERKSLKKMLENRVLRILLPMILFWMIVYPPTAGGFLYGMSINLAEPLTTLQSFFSNPWQMSGPEYAFMADFQRQTLNEFGWLHLWFLYHLFLYCMIGAALIVLLKPITSKLNQKVKTASIRWPLQILTRPLAFGTLIGIALVLAQKPLFDTSDRLIPFAETFILYGLFFLSGALIYKAKDFLDKIEGKTLKNLLLGSLSFVLFYVFLNQVIKFFTIENHTFLGLSKELTFLSTCFLSGWTTVFFVMGFLGLFKKFADTPSPFWSYILQSSYAVYILQLPFTIWIPILLRDFQAPALLKFSVTLSGTTLVTFLIYNYAIRPSWVGKLLNGKKYASLDLHHLGWKKSAKDVFANSQEPAI